jgi:cyanophycin synthetase
MTVNDLGLAGFRNRLRQPDQTLTIRLKHSTWNIGWADFDHWLTHKLGIDLQAYPQEGPWQDDATPQETLEFMWRILQIAAALQRAARIPVFDPGRILSVQLDPEQPDTRIVTVAVPRVDYVSAQSTHLAYEAASSLALGIAADLEKFADTEQVYRRLDEQVLQILQKVMPAGKSSMHLLRTAYEHGIPWMHLGGGIVQLGWGRHALRMRHSKSESDSALGVDAAQHKFLAGEWLRRMGLPAPGHLLVSGEDEAVKAAAALGGVLVIKPADRDRGEGVTVDINSEAGIREAYRRASAYSKQVLVERMVPGTCHRLLVVRGRVLYTVKRHPIGIQGDGRRTIAEGIQAANAQRMAQPAWKRPPPYPDDDLAREELGRVGLNMESILASGAWAPLRRIESTEWGGLDEDFSATLHPDNAAAAVQAAALFGLDIAGVDIISADITRPWHENEAIINEVNSSPLLGASQSSLNCLSALMARIVPGDGRIPIEAIAGAEDAMHKARLRQRHWTDRGHACFVTSHALTEDPCGNAVQMAAQGLFARCMALLMNKNVGAIVMAVQTDELLETGLPVDRLDRVERAAGELIAWKAASRDRRPGETEKTVALLLNHLSQPPIRT